MSTQVQLVFAAKRRAKPGAEHALAAARDWAQAERVVAACCAHSQLHRVCAHALDRHRQSVLCCVKLRLERAEATMPVKRDQT